MKESNFYTHPREMEPFFPSQNDEFNPDNLHGTKKLIAIASSHHRLAWIHPFVDGNGRVARLFTHAYMKKAQIESHGLWTISRGLSILVNRFLLLERTLAGCQYFGVRNDQRVTTPDSLLLAA